MSHALMLTMQNYCLALRQELGYPAFLPVNDSLKFGSGGAVDGLKALELGRQVVAMGRDLVYTAWTASTRKEPAGITLVLREQTNVDVINGCALWAANATAPLMIVAIQRNEHFLLGARGYVERRDGLPARKLGPGRRLARERVLRAVAAAKRAHLLPDNQMIPRGGQWVEPAANDDGVVVRVA